MKHIRLRLRIENGTVGRNVPSLHIVHKFGRELFVADDAYSLCSTLLPHLVRQQGHVGLSLGSGVPDDGLRVCRFDTVDDFLTKSLFGVWCSPQDAAWHFLGENDGKTWSNA